MFRIEDKTIKINRTPWTVSALMPCFVISIYQDRLAITFDMNRRSITISPCARNTHWTVSSNRTRTRVAHVLLSPKKREDALPIENLMSFTWWAARLKSFLITVRPTRLPHCKTPLKVPRPKLFSIFFPRQEGYHRARVCVILARLSIGKLPKNTFNIDTNMVRRYHTGIILIGLSIPRWEERNS